MLGNSLIILLRSITIMKILTPTGVDIVTYPNGIKTTIKRSYVDELQFYPPTSEEVVVCFQDFAKTWAAYEKDEFLKNFLIEGYKLAKQERTGEITKEVFNFYIQTLKTIVNQKYKK